MPRDTHRITPNPNGGWDLNRDNGKRVVRHFDNKEVAVDKSRVISRNQKTEFVVHKKDGEIQFADSHGNDPRNIPG